MDSKVKTKIQEALECLDKANQKCAARLRRVERTEKTKSGDKRKYLPTKEWVKLLWL